MIAALIIGCEIAFWVFVLAGLVARYLIGWKKTGAVLLASTPVVDVVLIAVTIIDLRNGATAELVHGLAAVYIGVTVAFGHRIIKWADGHFAYRFAKGTKPAAKPKHGKAHARMEREGWYRHLLAWGLGSLLLLFMIWIVGDADRTQQLADMALWWGAVVVIDFVISFSYTIWPKRSGQQQV
ncbi:hypothetical protein [Paenibacillus lemnae]|uniref:2TM domain-containing protein n=1 Tax=Paenibacillus lemnae TaxID=1330551 RepID=A0A848MC75_PAELE|nr:hypothetical protein [Paenibacillus lemnae]NMO97781.1 hypothetical protein [Paenibacillus lemnae]